jgi:two-component system sensor histidine kinase YesM
MKRRATLLIRKLKDIFITRGLIQQALIFYFILVLLPFVLVGFFIYKNVSQDLLNRAIETEQYNFGLLHQKIADELNKYIYVAKEILLDNVLYTSINAMGESTEESEQNQNISEEIVHSFNNYKILNPEIIDISVIVTNPKLKAPFTTFASSNSKDKEYYTLAMQNLYTQRIVCIINEENSNEIILCRVLTRYLKPYGVLKMRIAKRIISQLFENRQEGESIALTYANTSLIQGAGENVERLASLKGITPKISESFRMGRQYTYSSEKGPYILFESTLVCNNSFASQFLLRKELSVDMITQGVRTAFLSESIVLILITITVLTFFIVSSKSIRKRLVTLINNIKSLEKGDFSRRVAVKIHDEIGVIELSINKMSEELEKLVKQVYEFQLRENEMLLRQTQVELFALQSQINPHFLFNILDNILSTLDDNPKAAGEIIMLLARSLRRQFLWENDRITLGQELSFIDDYLRIQKVRMQNKLKYSIELDNEVSELLLPKFLLQPLVENAIIHGISKKRRGGHVHIQAFKEDKHLLIIVEDNGTGIEKQRLDRILQGLQKEPNLYNEHIGLMNVYRRIILYYGSKAKFNISSVEKEYTRIELRLPLECEAFSKPPKPMEALE